MRRVRTGGLLAAALLWLALPGLVGVAMAQESVPGPEDVTDADTELPAGPVEWADAQRPTPGLWLVIDDGRGPRLVVARQSNAVAPLVQSAGNHGLLLRLPQGGGQDDRQGLEAAWENNEAAARRLAGRYGSGELVLGRLARSGGGWDAQWRVIDGLGEVEQFSRSGTDALALLGAIGDVSARHLAQRSIDMLSAGPPGEHEVVVGNIGSAEDFIRLRAYLDGLAVVRDIQPVTAQGDSLRIRLALATGAERFDAMVGVGAVLERDGADRGTPRYRLR